MIKPQPLAFLGPPTSGRKHHPWAGTYFVAANHSHVGAPDNAELDLESYTTGKNDRTFIIAIPCFIQSHPQKIRRIKSEDLFCHWILAHLGPRTTRAMIFDLLNAHESAWFFSQCRNFLSDLSLPGTWCFTVQETTVELEWPRGKQKIRQSSRHCFREFGQCERPRTSEGHTRIYKVYNSHNRFCTLPQPGLMLPPRGVVGGSEGRWFSKSKSISGSSSRQLGRCTVWWAHTRFIRIKKAHWL